MPRRTWLLISVFDVLAVVLREINHSGCVALDPHFPSCFDNPIHPMATTGVETLILLAGQEDWSFTATGAQALV